MTEMPRNPYIAGGALTDPTGVGFYGRRDIYAFVRESLNAVQRNPILLYGQRRIGKTSILRQMPNYLPDNLVIVYFDLQGKALQPLDEVLFMLAREIRRHRAIKDHLDKVRREDVTEDAFAMDFLLRVFDVLGGDKYRLVLLFDEMDVIDAEQVENYTEVAAYTFREYMRTLMDEEQQVGYIFVVGRRPEELDETFNAQLFRGAAQKRIGHLSRGEMERLVIEQSQNYLHYPPETLDAIYALTDGHPFCTQLICHQLWNRCLLGQSQYPVVISPNDVEEAVPDAVIYGQTGLNWIYDGLVEPAHRLFLSSAAEVVDTEGNIRLSDILDNLRQQRIVLPQSEIQVARRDLVNWEILKLAKGDTYQFRVEMIRRWIATDRSLDQMRHEARFISRRAYQRYELADEYRQEGRLEDAIDNYERALEIYPQLIDAQVGLADTLRQMENWSAAIKAYEQLFELDPNRVDGLQEALLEYGSRLEQEKQIEQAIQQYERAAGLVANPRVQARLERTARDYGRRLSKEQRFEKALSLFERLGYEDEIEKVKKAHLDAWRKIEIQATHLTTQTDQPEWEKAYAIIDQYQQLNPTDENARQLRDKISRWERKWNNEQGDAHMADGQLEEAISFYQKADNKKKIKEATQKKAVLDLQEQVSEVGWKPLLDAARNYLSNYPDDSEISQLATEVEQGYREEADRLLAQKEIEIAVDAYQNLGDKDKAISALLAQWRDQMSKSTRNHLIWFAGLFGGGVVAIFIGQLVSNLGWSMKIVNSLFAIAIIVLLAAPYFLCLLIFSDLLMKWILRRSIDRQLHIDLPIAEIKRKIHNTEYIRPIPGSALGLGVISGIVGWVAIFGGVIPRISHSASGVYLGQFSLFDSLSTILLLSVIGIGLGVYSYQPQESPTASDEGKDEQPVTHLHSSDAWMVGCAGLSITLVGLLGFAAGEMGDADISDLQCIRCGSAALVLVSLVGFSRSFTRIRRIMNREIDFEEEE